MINKIKKIFSKKIHKKIKYLEDDKKIICEELEAPLFECGSSEYTQGYGWFGRNIDPNDNWNSGIGY